MPLQFVLYELPMDQGWAYYAASVEKDPWMQFCGVRLEGGYISQEVKHLLKLAGIDKP